MWHKFIRATLMIVCLGLASAPFTSHSATTAEPTASVEVPDWALAILSVKQLAGALDKAGAYANNLLPNSAELAKQIIMNAMFQLPVSAGVHHGPALIVAPDPTTMGTRNELAFILPAGDKEALKKVFIDTYGVPTEVDGVMTFVLPQPLPQPDKTLLVKFSGARLLAAPNPAVMKKLDEFASATKTDAMLAGTASADAVISINVGTVKRAYGLVLGAMLGMVEQFAGADRREQVQALSELVEMLWQLNAFEVRLSLASDGTTGNLEFAALPRLGTALAGRVAEAAAPVSADVVRLIPPGVALFAAWNVDGAKMATTLRVKLPKPTGPHARLAEESETALLSLLESMTGEVAVALHVVEKKSIGVLNSFRTQEPAKVSNKIKTAIEKLSELANADIQSRAATEPGMKGVQITLKGADAGAHGGVELQGIQIDATGIPPETLGLVQQILGWPLMIRWAVMDQRVLVATGAASSTSLKEAIDREKDAQPHADAAQDLKKAADSKAPILASIVPTQLARLLLGNLPLTPKVSLERLTQGLQDTPITITGRAEKAYILSGEVPVTAADAIGTIGQRLEGVNLKFDESVVPRGGDAPAPPRVK